ncbi:hypothetical protein Droror1_Dr00023526 [Drosera rotundifolia]
MLRVTEEIRSKIRDEHKVRLEKTPFWPMIRAMLDEKLDKTKSRKSDILIQEIIKKYHNDMQFFEIKGPFDPSELETVRYVLQSRYTPYCQYENEAHICLRRGKGS